MASPLRRDHPLRTANCRAAGARARLPESQPEPQCILHNVRHKPPDPTPKNGGDTGRRRLIGGRAGQPIGLPCRTPETSRGNVSSALRRWPLGSGDMSGPRGFPWPRVTARRPGPAPVATGRQAPAARRCDPGRRGAAALRPPYAEPGRLRPRGVQRDSRVRREQRAGRAPDARNARGSAAHAAVAPCCSGNSACRTGRSRLTSFFPKNSPWPASPIPGDWADPPAPQARMPGGCRRPDSPLARELAYRAWLFAPGGEQWSTPRA